MHPDVLSAIDLSLPDVPALPPRTRSALIAYLLRWECWDAARLCLELLLRTQGDRVSLYDDLAVAYLGLGRPERAVEIMKRRQAIRSSVTSRLREARVHLAAGRLDAAQAISSELRASHPDMLSGWSLQADIFLARGDWPAASAAIDRHEALQPEAAATAQLLARLWQSQGDDEQALLWTRTAQSRYERDQIEPTVALLHHLESLYRTTGQPAQVEATAKRLSERRAQETKWLRQALRQALSPEQQGVPATLPSDQPLAEAPAADSYVTELVAGAVTLSPDEQTRLHQALRIHFPHDQFRTGQADVIAAVLRGESVLAVMPTGSGKSLCYQLAALLLPGTTLVISPLIALMKDQLDSLPQAVAQQATTLNSTLEGAELGARLAQAAAGRYKLLYAAPERLRQRPFLHVLARAGVSLLVVDEAHCVSLWGHDFRPDYLFIAKAWHELGRPPILAMTATATPRVRDDIQSALGKMRLVAADVHRPNLRLEAHHFDAAAQKGPALLRLCQEVKGSGIVYARSRRSCERLAEMLREHGISAIHYHAGVEDRAAAQDRFMRNHSRIVVATIAFGMGVDKADVRFVVHYDAPRALENYYQEAGRAGRDGLPARCVLFCLPSDKSVLTRLARDGALGVELLRRVYADLQQRLGPCRIGRVAAADLERDLVIGETELRVAIHFLEAAGLLRRGFDLPRAAILELTQAPALDDSDEARFVAASRLRTGQGVPQDLLTLSNEAQIDPRTIEAKILAWQDEGWLRYRGTGRDMFLELPTAPPSSGERVAAMLADLNAGQDGRVAEMMSFAHTSGCRHGAISAYFGGRPIRQCQACDNCLGAAVGRPRRSRVVGPHHGTTQAPRPLTGGDWTSTILTAVAALPFPLGRTGLARALKGAATSPVTADRFPLYGAVGDRTQKVIGNQIAELEELGLLEPYDSRGYRLLRLTAKGRDMLGARP